MINKLKEKYPIYDFSGSDYVNVRTPIKVVCGEHGEFMKSPNLMLYNNQGCPKCGIENRNEKMVNDFDSLVLRFNEKHGGKYDYTLSNYVRNNIKIDIRCIEHGIFSQRPDNHLSGQGCPICSINSMSLKKTYTLDDFIDKSSNIHENKYSYIDSIYIDSLTPIDIICHKHGKFSQKPVYHMGGSGCPNCVLSKGERLIGKCLTNMKIDYICQYIFENCRYNNHLKFDFYLPYHNICIEYDGRQHFESVEIWGGEEEFIKTRKRDTIKNDYCHNNEIKLLRIPYWEKRIDKIIYNFLKNVENR